MGARVARFDAWTAIRSSRMVVSLSSTTRTHSLVDARPSMLCFFLSFSFLWFATVDIVLISLIVVMCSGYFVVIAWAISTAYERPHFEYAPAPVKMARRVVKATRRVSTMMSGGLDSRRGAPRATSMPQRPISVPPAPEPKDEKLESSDVSARTSPV